ncbi:uncharacterized protein LOC109852119 isoform X2 [Pseudomyrmex gracilis]|uniref:uncharacterized protein LOC109852119 isoform X2 n=1 Tax=Pseudomyrmex gracilis TaxID=219809 RepID=UPI000995A022|nr:uncharacterized protein LOC109852119 isoform X2 [Pseudomyrmex gracilis]
MSPVQPPHTLTFVRMNYEQEGNTKTYNEQGSVDSSDTYASCQTHPSHSQGDLTEEADSNLYVNPLEATEKCGRVKKSISGDVERCIVANASPSVESLKEIRPGNEAASKVNPNDTLPKHRKIRIQQNIKPRAQFVSDQEGVTRDIISREDTITEDNNNHYGRLRGGRPSPFTTTNSLASATRIINHHLFGSLGGSKHYAETSGESKLSLSADSIDSDGASYTDRHRISKSILKKSDSGNNYYSNTGDSDTEKLITDNVSTTSVCDNEMSDVPANANNDTRVKKRSISPLLSRQVLESIFRTNNNIESECTSDEADRKGSVTRRSKVSLGDVVQEDKHVRDEVAVEKQYKEPDEQLRRPKARAQQEQSKLILRPYKTKKSTTVPEEKRKASKSSGHGCAIYKSSDANSLAQEYRFSS